MISMELVTIILTIIGIVIIGITYVFIKEEKNTLSNFNDSEFEQYSNELNQTASDIYEELDEKYKEILVIYNLIEKKHSEIKNLQQTDVESKFDLQDYQQKNNVKQKTKINYVYKRAKNNGNYSENVFEKSKTKNHAVDILNSDIKSDESKSVFPSKKEDVNLLLSRGFTVEQIAKELNIGVGEVQLIKELIKVKNEQI